MQNSDNPHNLPNTLLNRQTDCERRRKEALAALQKVEGQMHELSREIREHFTKQEQPVS